MTPNRSFRQKFFQRKVARERSDRLRRLLKAHYKRRTR